MKNVPELGAAHPLPPEWFRARCTAEGCDRSWEAHGTINSRQALARAQKHANRTGHTIDAQHANRR